MRPSFLHLLPLALLLALPLLACDPAPPDPSCGAAPACASSADCASGDTCIDGCCIEGTDAGAPETDAGFDCSTCAAGQLCLAAEGRCEGNCRHPSASPCDGDEVCNFADGLCAAPGSAGLITGEPQACGESSCLPGTECGLDGECVAAPPCFNAECDEGACWARGCRSERPTGLCEPAPLERLNELDFIGGVRDGGAFDLEFDDACNAYTVTMISGTDYLRQLAPDGTLTVWDGVTNLNMGEVAVRRVIGGEFGSEEGPGQVGLTYICCATCGCVGTDPQGVARLDRESADTSLPMVIEAMPSTGDGPFGAHQLDTGPYGLTWGRDNRLYIGNVEAQGDFVRADLDTGEQLEIHRLPDRIYAACTFTYRELLVALANGEIHRVHDSLPLSEVWATLPDEDVTSMVRDPFTGRVYVSTSSSRILEYSALGEQLGELATTPDTGRLAYAADGYLYFLVKGFPSTAEVLRYELPSAL